jgi:polar amino acid transport system substrate-binding protein
MNFARFPHIRAVSLAAIACIGLTGLAACSSTKANTTTSSSPTNSSSSPTSASSAVGSTSPGAVTSSPATSAALDTLTPGVLKVTIEPYAPYTSVQNGVDVGLDADILQAAADKLGLKIENQVTDFTGMLASVQTHRADITIGGIAWGASRAAKGLFTDPVYYSPTLMAIQNGKQYSTIADFKGASLGTVDGYIWEPAIKAIPGATAKIYPDANGLFDDLQAGRLDVGFIDPLIAVAKKQADPTAKFTTSYITPPTAAEIAATPALSAFAPYMVSFYLPQQEPKLEAALNAQIRAMYADGTLASLVTKYGGDPAQFLKPTGVDWKARIGVDRSSDWQPPSV